jgi:hypothetical protein
MLGLISKSALYSAFLISILYILLIMKRFKKFEAKRYIRILKNLKNSLFQRALDLLYFANLTDLNHQIGKIVASYYLPYVQ